MPILGGYGNASEYAYRGFIIDTPNPFDWIDLYNVEPGNEYRSGYVKITGIKSPLPLRVSIGSSFSLVYNVFDNNQTVTFDNDDVNQSSFDEYTNPNNRFQPGLGFNEINDFVKNNQSIILSVNIPNVSKTDFSTTYTTNVSVGRSDQDWIVQTRSIDDTPDDFNFLGIQTTTSTLVESNEITVSGLESGYSFDANITSSSGDIVVNDVNRGKSFSVFNNDTIKLSFTTPATFDFPTDITIELGTYSTTWKVTTEIENLDVTFTPTDFTDQSNLQLNTDYNSNQITISDLSLNSDLPVTLTSGSYEVERGGSVIKSFTDNPIEVIDNDKIRLRLRSSSSYSRNVSTTMTIGNTSADWGLTTRAAPPPPAAPVPPPPPPPCQESYITNGYGGGVFCSSGIREGRWAQTGPTWTGGSTYNGNPNDFQNGPSGVSGRKRSVNDLYIQYFKRGADPGGMITYNQYWMSRLRQGASDGQIRNEIVGFFLGSAEYRNGWWRNNFIRTKCGNSIYGIRSNVRCR